MVTDTVQAWQVEFGDYVTLGSDTAFRVVEKDDTGDGISLMLADDEGECSPFHFTWDEDITIVSSFEEVDTESVEV